MRAPITASKSERTSEHQKPVKNWMNLDVAPLVAQRIYSKQPLPGEGPDFSRSVT